MLSSLRIQNFRTFSRLEVKRLAQVNLIVGKNGVGKTTLLEALRLYGSIWPPATADSILWERNEVGRAPDDSRMLFFHYLFHGRDPKLGDKITIGGMGADEREFSATADFETEPKAAPAVTATQALPLIWERRLKMQSGSFHCHLRQEGSGGWCVWSDPSGPWKLPDPPHDPPCLSTASLGEPTDNLVAKWWSELTAQSEEEVKRALRVVAPTITHVKFAPHPVRKERLIAQAQVEGVDELMPVATLGDGVLRMLQIAIVLEYSAVYAKQHASKYENWIHVVPLALIDEVETGIHYSLHADLWRFILHTARVLDVQVFATTHSWDCLKGFAEALADDEKNDGMVIRLERVPGEEQTGAVTIDRDDLPIVTRDSIEVR